MTHKKTDRQKHEQKHAQKHESKQPAGAAGPSKADAKADPKTPPETDPNRGPQKKTPAPGPVDYLDRINIGLEGLSPIQSAAVVALMSGCTISEAARVVDVHRNTIHRWIQEKPEFRRGLATSQNEMREAAAAQLHAMVRKATCCLESALDRGDARVALRYLQGVGYLGDRSPSRNPYEAERAERRREASPLRGHLTKMARRFQIHTAASLNSLLLAALLLVGVWNLQAGEPETPDSGSIATTLEDQKSQKVNFQHSPKSNFQFQEANSEIGRPREWMDEWMGESLGGRNSGLTPAARLAVSRPDGSVFAEIKRGKGPQCATSRLRTASRVPPDGD